MASLSFIAFPPHSSTNDNELRSHTLGAPRDILCKAHSTTTGSFAPLEDDEDPYLEAVRKGPPAAKKIPKELVDDEVLKLGQFAKLVPYRPRGMPYEAFKERCMGFVQGVLKRAGYSADRLVHVMPHCSWDKESCTAMRAELVGAIEKVSEAVRGKAKGAAVGLCFSMCCD